MIHHQRVEVKMIYDYLVPMSFVDPCDDEEYDDDEDDGDHIGAFRLSRQGIRSNSG